MLEKSNLNQSYLQQKQDMLFGADVKSQVKLNPIEIKNIEKNFVGMYFALAAINWGRGMTLGQAWQSALEQLGAFVAAKTKIANHPINAHLTKCYKEFRRDMSKHIMTCPYSKHKLRPEYAQSFINYGTKRTMETKNSLNNLYQKYMPKTQIKTQFVGHKFAIAKQKTHALMQKIISQQMTNQRAA